MKKYLLLCALALLVGAALYYGWNNQSKIAERIPGLEKETTILTFEVPTSIGEVMRLHEKELLRGARYSFGKATVRYSPCLLFSVKYTRENSRTEESKLLFSLEDGEMFLDTRSAEQTRGFEDCLICHADTEDFKLLHVLQRKGGSISKEALAHELGLQSEQVFHRLDTLRRKHLVAIHGDMVRIHLPTPLLKVLPDTKMGPLLVSKTVLKENLLPENYSKGDVRRLMKAVFGADFAIKAEEVIYVPIFQVDIKNPDGSILKTFWSGLTGRRIEQK